MNKYTILLTMLFAFLISITIVQADSNNLEINSDENTAFFENGELVFPELVLPDGTYMHQAIFEMIGDEFKFVSDYKDENIEITPTDGMSVVNENYTEINIPRIDVFSGFSPNSVAYSATLIIESLSPRICLKLKHPPKGFAVKVKLKKGNGSSNIEEGVAGADYNIPEGYIEFYKDKVKGHFYVQIQNQINRKRGHLDFTNHYNKNVPNRKEGTFQAFPEGQLEPVYDISWNIVNDENNFITGIQVDGIHNDDPFQQKLSFYADFELDSDIADDRIFLNTAIKILF